jgi:hypothetical protein
MNRASIRVRVTLRLTVNQSVRLGVEPHLGLMTKYYLLFDSYCLVLGRAPSLTRGRVCRLSESVSSITSIVIMYNFYILHVSRVLEYIWNIYKASVSPGSVQQIMPYFWKLSLQQQSSHLNGRMLGRRQVLASCIFCDGFRFVQWCKQFRYHNFV